MIRLLWAGGMQDYHGRYYTVENARIYTLPDQLPPIMIAASGPLATELAGRLGDGLISVEPDPEAVTAFDAAGGTGKPRLGQFKVCWAPDEAEARRTAHEWWPIAALKGAFAPELPLPAHFEQVASLVSEEDVAHAILCGPDPERYIATTREFAGAGYDQVYIHQVGPDQEGFLRFYEQEIAPRLRRGSLAC